MKCFLSLYILSSILIFSQSDWTWQNPLPQGNTLYSVSFGDTNTGWAVGDHGTIIKTTDGGETWSLQQSTVTERLHSVHAFDENTVYAVGENGTVLKTIDGGENWNAHGGNQTGINESFFIDENIGWIIGNSGKILFTSDAGNNWTLQGSGTNADLFGVDFINADSGWVVGADTTILMTTDGGINWSTYPNMFTKHYNINLKESKNSGEIPLLTSEETYTDVVFENGYGYNLSVIAGAKGTVLVADLTDPNNYIYTHHNLGGFHLTKIEVVDSITILVWGKNGCYYRSTDRGATFSPGAITPDDILGAGIYPHNPEGLFVVGEDGLLFKSTDKGETWSAISRSVVRTTTKINDLWTNDGSKVWAAGQSGKVLITTDGGDDWTEQTTGTTDAFESIVFVDENTGWIISNTLVFPQGTYQGNVFKTTDGGSNWFIQTSGILTKIFDIEFIDINTGWIVGGSGTILKSTDGGNTWDSQISGTENGLNSISFADENTGWAVGSNGTILYTTDGGIDWIDQASGTTNHLSDAAAIDGNICYTAGSSGVLLKTQNGGATWEHQTSGTTNHIRAISFIDENTGWAAGLNGTFLRKTNGRTDWLNLNIGTGNDLEAVAFIDANMGWTAGNSGAILKTTTGGGITSLDETDTEIKPGNFILYQNYPNPFNPTTTIEYTIPEVGDEKFRAPQSVKLIVYDILGREVATLVNNKKQQPGSYAVSFNGTYLSSGIYLYWFQSGHFSQAKKMTLIK